MINRNACFAYFNKSWGIPRGIRTGGTVALSATQVRGHSFRFRRSGAATFSASDQGTAESRIVRIEAAASRDAGPDDTLEHVTENIAAAEALVAGA
jgi:hypothetical protein